LAKTSHLRFADHFSTQASAYRRHRPGYPPALFDYLTKLCPSLDLAWDCGCGNGQATLDLAAHFRQVLATDPSPQQLAEAPPRANVRYRAAAETDALIASGSVDLVTAAQAAHWFDAARFHHEVKRVLKPGGVLAVWTYGLPRVNAAVDACVNEFHGAIVGRYWPPERVHVDTGYRDLPFPFPDLPVPELVHATEWTLEQLLQHLGTWSAVKYFRERNGADPIELIRAPLHAAWGDENVVIPVRWPISLRAGRKPRD